MATAHRLIVVVISIGAARPHFFDLTFSAPRRPPGRQIRTLTGNALSAHAVSRTTRSEERETLEGPWCATPQRSQNPAQTSSPSTTSTNRSALNPAGYTLCMRLLVHRLTCGRQLS